MQIANRSFRRYSERIQNSMGDITRVAKEAIDAHRLIKIFNAEDHQTERFELVNELNRASNMKLRARQIHQQSGGAGASPSIALARRAVRGHTSGVRQRHAGRPVLGVSDGADAHSLAAAQPGQHRRSAAAGHRRGAERVRDTGPADRRRRRYPRASPARAARSSFATSRSSTRARRAGCCTT